MTKFCVDCKHCVGGTAWASCAQSSKREKLRTVELVVGPLSSGGDVSLSNRNSCWNQRYDGWLSSRLTGSCGAEGRWWEPKE